MLSITFNMYIAYRLHCYRLIVGVHSSLEQMLNVIDHYQYVYRLSIT